jgi:hypothetical protein
MKSLLTMLPLGGGYAVTKAEPDAAVRVRAGEPTRRAGELTEYVTGLRKARGY